MTGRLLLRLGALAALAAALCVSGAWAPAAHALTARFQIDGGAAYTRGTHVTAGDAGWSPFFRPGVVVWDGGSIVQGHGADPGYEYPAQTLAVLGHPTQSFVFSSPSAKIADMLADAPLEIDVLHDPDADLNVCVVLAGGGDFRLGTSAAVVYEGLRTYCLERRAAGFRVVVLSVLPSSRPQTFPATRLAFNTMLREGWDEFADGLADLAADPRIGDDGDQFDSQFYLEDALHLTNAGQSVMAAVTAPVLADQPWISSRCEMRLREIPGAWEDWRPYAARTNIWLGDYDGEHFIEAEYRLDGGTPVAASDTILVDRVRPEPHAQRTTVTRRFARTKLRYRVDDAEPCGPTSTVTLKLTTASGKVLKAWVRRLVPVNEPQTFAFTCTARKGSYRWVVRARDAAGNPDAAPATGVLTVR